MAIAAPSTIAPRERCLVAAPAWLFCAVSRMRLRDGDPIRAVIKATAINNDGASKAGYLAPSVTGQAEAIVEAQTLAGVMADTLQYVECHGTGTRPRRSD